MAERWHLLQYRLAVVCLLAVVTDVVSRGLPVAVRFCHCRAAACSSHCDGGVVDGACLPAGSGSGSARSVSSVWRFAVVQRSIILACLYVWFVQLPLKRRLSVLLGLQHGCWLNFAFT
jgi:hypothetical protein